jgi:hypothetical protein
MKAELCLRSDSNKGLDSAAAQGLLPEAGRNLFFGEYLSRAWRMYARFKMTPSWRLLTAMGQVATTQHHSGYERQIWLYSFTIQVETKLLRHFKRFAHSIKFAM